MAGGVIPTVSEDTNSRRMYLVLALALIVAAAVIGMQWWLPMHGGVDENGYLMAGKMLAENGTPALRPDYGPDGEVPTFVGDMWLGVGLGTPQERYYTKYPPGVPALMAVAMLAGGESWGPSFAYLLNPAGYCLGLIATYLLVRRLTGSVPALGALVCVICSGPVVRLFTIPGSHGISFGVLAWALYALVSWVQAGGLGMAIAAGLLCGFGGIVRTGELVLLTPLLVAVGGRVKAERSRRAGIEGGAMLAGWGLPFVVAAAIQTAQLGSWSAYASTGEGAAFSIGYFWDHFSIMLLSLTWRGVALAAPLGVAGLLLLLRYNWRVGAVLLTWVGANVVLYTAYYWAPLSEFNVYARFFLPSYPALVAGAAGLFVWPAARGGFASLAVMAALLLGVVSGGATVYANWVWARVEVISRNVLESRINWTAERVPADAVLLCDELDMLNHLQFASAYRLYDFRLFRAEQLTDLVDNNELNSLQRARKEYLRDRFLSRGQAGLTEMRDRMVAGYIKAGRRVFVFSGPLDQWESWAGLGAYGLAIRPSGEVVTPRPPLPIVPARWKLQEIVPATP